MTHVLWLLPMLAALVGHFAFALFLFNRLHAQAWRYRSRQALERLLVFVTLAIPLMVIASVWPLLLDPASFSTWRMKAAPFWWPVLAAYACFCWSVLLVSLPIWLWPKLRYRLPAELLANDTRNVDLRAIASPTVSGSFPRLCVALPGNEVFRLQVQTKRLRLPRLPRELAGLRVAHLTDLHLTGKIGREYYEEVVRLTNELQPDLIIMTGDIAERTKCLPWVQPLFGQLQAPLGKFFILGNHDFLLPDAEVLRSELKESRFVDLAGRSEQVDLRGTKVLFAGNELPWHGPAPEVPPPDEAFRILLAHTPDLFPWAQEQQFDLMLAGHNHGGQICLPGLGALVSPSRYGVRYAGGMFRQGSTLLHVSRGIAGEHLLRWNCPPELALLVLE